MEKEQSGDEGEALSFSPEEFERRHRKIRDGMQLRGMDCLIITGNSAFHGAAAADVRYVAGLSEFFQPPYILFPLADDPVLFAASPAIAARTEKTSRIPVEPVSFKKGTRIRDYASSIGDKIKKLGLEKGTIGIVTMRVMPADTYCGILRELPDANLMSADDIILECRRIKSPEEMAFIRKAGECSDKGVEAIVEAAHPGVTEEELIAHCDSAMVNAGTLRGNFILLGSGAWPEMQGTIGGGTRRKLQKGDLILNEITACYGGYFVQLCAPISLGGDTPDDFRDLLKIHEAMYGKAFEKLRPGNTIYDIEEEVAAAAASHCRDFKRAWATQVSELAEAFFKMNTELRAGMSYVIHPWTEFASGKGFEGHTIGNTCIVTESEPEVVNKCPMKVIVV